ncbi:uncharacterized protein LOC132194920 [Neocloeon triangulifer]|uniref:uncharacterized protein LOC132194920 n=1 Tax=Neocloeon triangulifer TaxID=2078957 RepID=UPI00286F8350|nr:uncharacterized protein LOC132194920 [Neocloeon triangulifer]
MLYGRLIDETILEMAETLAVSDTVREENMNAISACGSIKGMDECDTASLVLQCGLEKAPDLVENILNTVEVNSSSDPVPLPSVSHKCPADFECVIDPKLREDYINNRPIPNGEIVTACGIKYVHQHIRQLYTTASSFCCSYGLKLAYFENVTNGICLVNSKISDH